MEPLIIYAVIAAGIQTIISFGGFLAMEEQFAARTLLLVPLAPIVMPILVLWGVFAFLRALWETAELDRTRLAYWARERMRRIGDRRRGRSKALPAAQPDSCTASIAVIYTGEQRFPALPSETWATCTRDHVRDGSMHSATVRGDLIRWANSDPYIEVKDGVVDQRVTQARPGVIYHRPSGKYYLEER